ncbi:DgyrCDS10083 [Dimorphilus gyrociliatus]|uniref:proteasome endopeptidase complex n=1 Tax=Dimorphilus gyrociliatus TaxID=2664684 RepID=A0A7I8W0D2_9ANNE|nr:DgyrCDS10083 [Dimorphilus gyrociliatus]
MAAALAEELPKSGFNFDNCIRNRLLEGKGLKAPKALKTGTTIAGVIFKDGVVLGADTRATEDTIVAEKNCEKIHYIQPNVYCCGAGTAADTEKTTKMVSSQMELHRLNTGRQVRFATVNRALRQMLFRYQGHISAALVLGGVDVTGPHLSCIYPHGSSSVLPFVTMGSGSLAAMAVFEQGYKPDMERAEAMKLVRDAIAAGIFNDLGSGSYVDLCVITKDRTDYLRPFDQANEKGKRQGVYQYPKGTTAILEEKVKKISFDVVDSKQDNCIIFWLVHLAPLRFKADLCSRNMTAPLRRLSRSFLKSTLGLSREQRCTAFYEADRKGGYSDKTTQSLTLGNAVKKGLPMILPECKKFAKEWQDNLKLKHIFPLNHGDYEVLWRFDEDDVKDWLVTCDSDLLEGKSKAEILKTENETALFRGFLDIDVPDDGHTKNAGYANIRAPVNMKSFKRQKPYDWSDYTHLLLKVRGDGRAYSLVLAMDRYFDIQWNDVYQYPLFTRGGPYWQIAKIPFSKFFLASKGRIQDKQQKIDRERIKYLAITASDRFKGEFNLEIDFVGILRDETHKEEFHYEMYYVDTNMLY